MSQVSRWSCCSPGRNPPEGVRAQVLRFPNLSDRAFSASAVDSCIVDDSQLHWEHTGNAEITWRTAVLRCLAIVSAVCAVIHFAVAGSHYQEYWAFGAFMLATGFLQSLLAVGLISYPRRPVLLAGAALNLGIVAVYVVTRTVGDVIGPTPHEVEPLGFGDVLCTCLEAVTAIALIWLALRPLARPLTRSIPQSRLAASTALVGVIAAALLGTALVDGGPEMVMAMGADDPSTPAGSVSAAGTANAGTSMPGMQMGGSGAAHAVAISLPTDSPAGAITMPAAMQMETGMKMAGPACTTSPTAAQQTAAVSLVDSSWAAAKPYQALATAKAAGYLPITPTGLPVVHYLNPSYYRATVRGGQVLNVAQPQSLVYANTPQGAVLVAAMFIMGRSSSTPPQPGGCLTQWHEHTNLCFADRGVIALASPSCPDGSVNRVTPPMLHVWFVPIPGGPTAIDAPDNTVVRAAEKVGHPNNGTA